MAETLRSLLPPSLDRGKALLVNSGSEALESAIKLARAVTGRSMVLAFIDGFHGRPMGALAATGSSSGLSPPLGRPAHRRRTRALSQLWALRFRPRAAHT